MPLGLLAMLAGAHSGVMLLFTDHAVSWYTGGVELRSMLTPEEYLAMKQAAQTVFLFQLPICFVCCAVLAASGPQAEANLCFSAGVALVLGAADQGLRVIPTLHALGGSVNHAKGVLVLTSSLALLLFFSARFRTRASIKGPFNFPGPVYQGLVYEALLKGCCGVWIYLGADVVVRTYGPSLEGRLVSWAKFTLQHLGLLLVQSTILVLTVVLSNDTYAAGRTCRAMAVHAAMALGSAPYCLGVAAYLGQAASGLLVKAALAVALGGFLLWRAADVALPLPGGD